MAVPLRLIVPSTLCPTVSGHRVAQSGEKASSERQAMLRRRLSFANVMSVMAVFIALGGSSYAISKLPKNSVGKKQLKANAVTTAKIKKSAVSKAKIKEGAVDRGKIEDGAVTGPKIKDGVVTGAKVADGSLTQTDINVATMQFSRVVAKARGSSTVAVSTSGFTPYPLDNATYTQAGNEDDRYVAAVDVTIPATCEGPTRYASALLLIDTNPASPSEADFLGTGAVVVEGTGSVTKRIEIGSSGTRFQPGAAKVHTLTVLVDANCTTGGGVTATFAGVDVIGTTS